MQLDGKLRDWWPTDKCDLSLHRSPSSTSNISAIPLHGQSSACANSVVSSHGSTAPCSSGPAGSDQQLITKPELHELSHGPDSGSSMNGAGAPASHNSTATTPLSSSTSSSLSPATALRLSEVAAALNAMPCQPLVPSSTPPTTNLLPAANSRNPSPSASSSRLTLSRPVPKLLGNTPNHKEVLLRKLLSRSESASDLQIGMQHYIKKTPPSPPPVAAPMPLTPSPPAPAVSLPSPYLLPQEVGWKEIPASCEAAAPLTAKMPAICSTQEIFDIFPYTRSCKHEERSNSQKRMRDTAISLKTLDTPLKQPPLPALELPSIQRESLTRREIHIFSERQRRKGMTHLYSILHSMLPDAKTKTDRCTVLTDAIHFIHDLQSRIDELTKKKNEILAELGEQPNMGSATSNSLLQGANMDEAESARQRLVLRSVADELREDVKEEILSAADVVVHFCGQDAFITLNSSKTRGVWSAILQVLHQQEMDLLNVTLSTSNDMDYHCIHTKISSTASKLRSQDLQKILQEVVLTYAIKE